MTTKYYKEGHTPYRMADMGGDSRVGNVLGAVRAHTPKGGRVVDLGCGDAYLRTQLPDHNYVGVDIDGTKAKDILSHDLSQTPYPLPSASFDTVICSEVLEHMWKPEDVVLEIKRLLKPRGHAVITVPNFDAIEHRLSGYISLLYDRANTFSVEHIRHYTVQSLGQILGERGFEIKEVRGNSPHMSPVFNFGRKCLATRLGSQLEADQLLGDMFPNMLPGFLLLAQKK